jgi:hypothetical protein
MARAQRSRCGMRTPTRSLRSRHWNSPNQRAHDFRQDSRVVQISAPPDWIPVLFRGDKFYNVRETVQGTTPILSYQPGTRLLPSSEARKIHNDPIACLCPSVEDAVCRVPDAYDGLTLPTPLYDLRGDPHPIVSFLEDSYSYRTCTCAPWWEALFYRKPPRFLSCIKLQHVDVERWVFPHSLFLSRYLVVLAMRLASLFTVALCLVGLAASRPFGDTLSPGFLKLRFLDTGIRRRQGKLSLLAHALFGRSKTRLGLTEAQVAALAPPFGWTAGVNPKCLSNKCTLCMCIAAADIHPSLCARNSRNRHL